jgi:hypothetical protein
MSDVLPALHVRNRGGLPGTLLPAGKINLPWKLAGRICAAIAVAAFCATSAYADSCADLRREARSGGSRESAALSRQLAALQRLERQRGCSSKARGGFFFDPCAEVAARKAEVLGKMASTRGGAAPARLAALGCAKEKRRHVMAARNRAPARPYVGDNAILYCVRMTDGYFFPVPRSQFVGAGDYKEIVDQCRYICQGSETAVFRLDDPALETEEMISVETAKPYKQLPTAFAYRDRADFKACDFQSYYRRVEEARARTVTPSDMKNAVIPVPRDKPQSPVARLAFTSQTPPPAVDKPLDRKVRVVGPDFFPD